MIPIGSKVRIRNVSHLAPGRRPQRLLGKTAAVLAHADGMHEVAIIHGAKGRGVSIGLIRWMLAAEDLELIGQPAA